MNFGADVDKQTDPGIIFFTVFYIARQDTFFFNSLGIMDLEEGNKVYLGGWYEWEQFAV